MGRLILLLVTACGSPAAPTEPGPAPASASSPAIAAPVGVRPEERVCVADDECVAFYSSSCRTPCTLVSNRASQDEVLRRTQAADPAGKACRRRCPEPGEAACVQGVCVER